MNLKNEYGFTLIEVVIAMGVLGIGIIAMYSMQVSGIRGNATANRITAESTWGADRIETMVAKDYDDSMFNDNDKDGTDQDMNEDGIDETGGEFGLNDVGAEADGNYVTSDGWYTVYWNVAEDYPVNDSKTVRLIVQQNSTGKQLTVLEYIKSDPI